MGFDPSQARDDHGRWSGGGGGSGGTLSSGELANYAHASRGGKGTASPGGGSDVHAQIAKYKPGEGYDESGKFTGTPAQAAVERAVSQGSRLTEARESVSDSFTRASVGQQDHAEPTPQQGDADRHSAATAADTKAAGSMSRAAKVDALVSEGGYSREGAKAFLTDAGE